MLPAAPGTPFDERGSDGRSLRSRAVGRPRFREGCDRATLAPVSASADVALLSSIASQIEELAARVTSMAERYGVTPDSAAASELFGAERSLLAARRSLERASRVLEDVA